MSVISEIGRLGQEDLKFKASLSYIVGPCLKNQTKGRKERREEGGGRREEGGFICARLVLYCLSHTPSLFAMVIF
jgi:hypothetical protein